jgi:hypothetical protein
MISLSISLQLTTPPFTFLSASGVSFYGIQCGAEEKDESAPLGKSVCACG